jgi:hypothetical protein
MAQQTKANMAHKEFAIISRQQEPLMKPTKTTNTLSKSKATLKIKTKIKSGGEDSYD